MKNDASPDAALAGLRVLDLADEKGWLCGSLLGSLGADVIKIEPPGGDPTRSLGPFFHNHAHCEQSLHWFFFNRSKRGITLNLTVPSGRDLFQRLAASADVILESFPPAYLDGIGLGYATLSALNPGLILTSITPFGQSGPYMEYEASDIVGMAMGGLMSIQGDADRPPVRTAVSQAYAQAGMQAAVGTLIAYYHRQLTGEGQQIDVSMQAAVTYATDCAPIFWDLERFIPRRLGSRRTWGQVVSEQVWEAKGGYVVGWLGMMGGQTGAVLLDWMREAGAGEDPAEAGKGLDLGRGVSRTQDMTQEDVERREARVTQFLKQLPASEAYEEGQRRGLEIGIMCEFADILSDVQLQERGFFIPVAHPELGESIVYPGAPFKMSESPLCMERRAPLLGEHNEAVYLGELGLSPGELQILKEANVV